VETPTMSKEKTMTSNLKMGMVFFLISEAFLFGSLFTTYYYLRTTAPVWPPAGIHPDDSLAIANTVLLLFSSLVIWWAGWSIKKGKERNLAVGLAFTAALAVAFLAITGYEWAHESFRPWTSAYGSIFYTLTGFHALHVFAGVLMMISLLAQTLRHHFSADNYVVVEAGTLYWHFVDFIWILVFISIFIIK